MADYASEDIETTVGEVLEDVVTTLVSDSCDKIRTNSKWVSEDIIAIVARQKPTTHDHR